MTRVAVVIASCLIALSVETAQHALAQPRSAVDLPLTPHVREGKPLQRARWHFEERAYPLGVVPHDAPSRALERIERLKVERARARPADEAAGQTQKWVNIGSAPIATGFSAPTQSWSGRITSIAVDPGNASHWLIGTAEGGIWQTLDGGATWAPKTDGHASLAIGALAFAFRDPNVVYAGTGEANLGWTYAGQGLLKSLDGGTTWSHLAGPTFAGTAFSDVRVHPENPDIVAAATVAGFAGRSFGPVPAPPPTGVFKSTDGGATWSRTLSVQATSLAIDPANFDNQYAGAGARNGSPQNGLYRSTDGGSTWTTVQGPWNSLPGSVGRIVLALAPSSPNVIYVGIHNASARTLLGLFRTDNAWDVTPTWIQIPNGLTGEDGYCGTQCDYNQALSVDPSDASTLYAGGRRSAWRCTACGLSPTWTDVGNRLHADYHALMWVGTRLIAANDGGIWSSTDAGKTWTNHNTNLSITQFYGGSLHPTDARFALGGAQDNGSMKWTGGAAWQFLRGGDGTDSVFSSSRPDTHWALSDFTGAGLSIVRTTDGGASFAAADTGIDKTRSAFTLQHVERCAANEDVLITGTDTLWRTNDFFSASSPTWAANGPKVNGRISALAFAASDGSCQTYAVGTTTGQLSLTVNGGATWVELDALNAVPNRVVTDLAFDPDDANTLYVTLSGFDEGTPGQPGHVFKTTSALAGGPTWVNSSPPVNLPCNTIALDPRNPGVVYVGADIGVWKSADGGANWRHLGPETGLPNVAVFDLKMHETTPMLVAFTYGRGAFSLPLLPELSPSLRLNESTFWAGRTLVASVGMRNPSLPETADFYVGILRPDGIIEAFSSTGSVMLGSTSDLRSIRPIATDVSLRDPFSVALPDTFTRQWKAADPLGAYVFFVVAVRSGALADGVVAENELLALTMAPFSVIDPSAPRTIIVDGNPADWVGIVPLMTDPAGDGPFDSSGNYYPNSDFVALSVTNDSTHVYFLLEAHSSVALENAFARGVTLFLDTDQDAGTSCGTSQEEPRGYEYVIFRITGGFGLGDHRSCGQFQNTFPGSVTSVIGSRFVELSVPIQTLRILTPGMSGFRLKGEAYPPQPITVRDTIGPELYRLK